MRRLIAIALLTALFLSGCRAEPEPIPSVTTMPDIEPSDTTAPSVTKPTSTEPTATEPPPTETEPPLTGWQEIDGQRYFYSDEGIPLIGWLEQDGNRFYFREDGTMARGKVVISDNETRYFTSTGKEVILVNPWNFVPDDYEVVLGKCKGWQVAAECVDDLKQMLSDCKAAGYSAVIVSAYRTHSYQANLYQHRIQRFIDQGYSREKAEIEAAKRVAHPGTSEHELGLALDIVDESYQKLTTKQETTPAQQWLMANCWRYGFILRYPSDKSHQTGIIYEPWHYRYVGKELAEELHDTGLCLEEYLDSLTID